MAQRRIGWILSDTSLILGRALTSFVCFLLTCDTWTELLDDLLHMKGASWTARFSPEHKNISKKSLFSSLGYVSVRGNPGVTSNDDDEEKKVHRSLILGLFSWSWNNFHHVYPTNTEQPVEVLENHTEPKKLQLLTAAEQVVCSSIWMQWDVWCTNTQECASFRSDVWSCHPALWGSGLSLHKHMSWFGSGGCSILVCCELFYQQIQIDSCDCFGLL